MVCCQLLRALIQLDNLAVKRLPGVVTKHFTAQNVISPRNVLIVQRKTTTITSARFLEYCKEKKKKRRSRITNVRDEYKGLTIPISHDIVFAKSTPYAKHVWVKS